MAYLFGYNSYSLISLSSYRCWYCYVSWQAISLFVSSMSSESDINRSLRMKERSAIKHDGYAGQLPAIHDSARRSMEDPVMSSRLVRGGRGIQWYLGRVCAVEDVVVSDQFIANSRHGVTSHTPDFPGHFRGIVNGQILENKIARHDTWWFYQRRLV